MTPPLDAAGRGRPPVVPGYSTGRLLGFGGSGEVWSAVEERSGQQVALKVLPVGGETREAVLRESLVLRRIDHQHVVRLRDVVEVDDAVVLVLDHAPGGSLAALVGARGALDPGEVVTVLSPLASALADLHARGLVHADVSPGNVLFAGDGRPLLSDLGVAALIGLDGPRHGTPGFTDPQVLGGGPATPSGDVFGLCAVGWFALTGHAPAGAGSRPPLLPLAPGTPQALAAVVESGLDALAPRRPTATQLAVRIFDAAVALPVRLVPTDPGAAAAEVVTHRLRAEAAQEPDAGQPPTRSRRPRRSRWPVGRRRRLVAPGLGGLALAGVLVAGVLVAGVLVVGPAMWDDGAHDAPTSSVSAVAETSATSSGVPADLADLLQAATTQNPADAVPALAAMRALGFATGAAEPLEQANVPGSASLRADERLLSTLEERGIRLQGLTFTVRSADVVSSAGDGAVVRVGVVTGEHRRVRADDGALVSAEPASAVRVCVLTLQRVDGRWRVSVVT